VASFMLQPLYSEARATSTHWIGGWVGPIADAEAMVKRKISHHCPYWELNPNHPACSLVITLNELT